MPQYLSILFQTSDEGLPERLVRIKDSDSPRIIRSGHFLSKESIVHWVHGDYHLAERNMPCCKTRLTVVLCNKGSKIKSNIKGRSLVCHRDVIEVSTKDIFEGFGPEIQENGSIKDWDESQLEDTKSIKKIFLIHASKRGTRPCWQCLDRTAADSLFYLIM